jgi:dCMP deaminase
MVTGLEWAQKRPPWDVYFASIAVQVAKRADCRRRAVGCVIVDSDHRIIATGYNGSPSGAESCLDGKCPRGLSDYQDIVAFSNYDNCIAIHAEANALLYARTSCKGATAYITCPPCPSCAKLMAAAGIERIVVP